MLTGSHDSPHASKGQTPERHLALVLNGAEERLQILLLETQEDVTGQLVFQEWSVFGRAMQVLAPALEQLLGHVGRTPADIGRIACVRGPGSFTGLRLVMATALGLAQATGADMASLDYLPLLAASAPDQALPTAVVTHSRRRQVYLQIFHPAQETPGKLIPPSMGPAMDIGLDRALEHLTGLDRPVQVLGSGLLRNLDFFREQAGRSPQIVLKTSPELAFPKAHVLAEAALSAPYGPEPFDPIYLRGSDAEENLEAIAAKRGLSEKEARRMLDSSRPDLSS